ncbi:LuxR family transcriptional regulator [Rhizobium leguminosarum]|jgi:DNA-binding CsgD family transcriptional regulator|uniref:helix-turn-helix transcriptional regulator n=1 Tax=Rhizobium ruizarguesonis TaxID=2081791 RepID=UPI0003792077|nr:LuxR family transcriptional regulator [Rhizobium ruizarguesonis]NEH75234.1 LuxR family transcriptional regulator [Rhizobium ruizarguesonis]NEI20951.1 LuxR family transcriptional regulator [Rhizobium ruizarguesonis]NEI76261.1 LuxR family transcriptional regulator [Rhizobium ruizarguesonis]NEJ12481.1 LuxR family transcriptional regulator [Rhizobium ruizarguesonis]NEK26464.1 LuxR family transcriptional regulator [Rhizobium ruizarguesonis]
MAENIPPDVFSSLLGQIYECALFPERWPATIETIRCLLPDISGLDVEQLSLPAPAANGAGNGNRGGGDIRIAAVPDLDAILIGHLERAVSIGRVARDRAVASELHEANVDSWGSGVLLVDEALYLIRANRAGESMIERGNPVRLRGRSLELRPASAQKTLLQAVAKATGGTDGSDTVASGAPINFIADGGGAPVVIQVMAMREDLRPELPILRSAVAIVLISPMATRSPPQQALSALYRLTPAEARVLQLLGEGSMLSEIADTLQLKRSTVKTHMLRIFAKTSTNRQADLVGLAHSLSLPV